MAVRPVLPVAAPVVVLAVALAGLATSAVAQTPPRPGQVWTPRPGVTIDPHRYQADQHRYEMERLRRQADERAALARQIQLESELRRQAVEAARQPALLAPSGTRALRSPEEERALRLSAAERRQAVETGAGEINGWLDRGRTEPPR